MKSLIPTPKIKQRIVDSVREKAALDQGLSPLIAKMVSSRPFLSDTNPASLLSPRLKMLDNPNLLPDIEKSVLRLIEALENNEVIGIETDHDCDGQTSHAVIYTALIEFFGHAKERTRSYIGHRLKEGYGLSEGVLQRILADEPRPTLIITADNGSSDEIRIAELKKQGIDVIVTDHHEIPSTGIPLSAYAVINPIREDGQYPDHCIAGCMVAWLFMAATRQKLNEVRNTVIPSLAEILDFVAVGTIADCVSMARSYNNRAVVAYGMKLIQQGLRPCWKVLLPTLSQPMVSEDLGFKIGPLLNSDGRLACAFGSVSFLLAKDTEEAAKWVEHLQIQNTDRKNIQDKVTRLATEQAKAQYAQGKNSLCLFLEEGHAGVHGISASRIKDTFGRPTIVFCPKAEDVQLVTGSARSIEGLHLRNVLQEIDDQHPGIIARFGGHQGAAGLTVYREHLSRFEDLFEKGVSAQVTEQMIGPVVWTDGELPTQNLTLPYIGELLAQMEPFGREFEMPIFEAQARVLELKPMGQTQTHARLGLAIQELWIEAVWFNGREREDIPWGIAVGEEVKLVYSPKLQTFRGKTKLSCHVVHIEKYRGTVNGNCPPTIPAEGSVAAFRRTSEVSLT